MRRSRGRRGRDVEPARARDVSVAKAYVGRASIEILGECVQLHGGIAMTWSTISTSTNVGRR